MDEVKIETSEGESDLKTFFFENLFESTKYCYSCNKCVNVCPYSYSGAFNPRRLIADLNLLTIEETLQASNIWNCLTCGTCLEYCPMYKNKVGVNIVEIVQKLRTLSSDYEPLDLEKKACHYNRDYTNLGYLMANDKIKIKNRMTFLTKNNLKISSSGEIAYFVGCSPFMNSVPPCNDACPAGVDVQGYISLIAEGKYQEASDLIRLKNPLPLVCGRVCTQPCESACNRQTIEAPIAIRALKRFVTDWELKNKPIPEAKPIELTKDKVAIIGSGPAGITAAYYLVQSGYKPTIFEASPYKGGMLQVGIPNYRLPKDLLDYEINLVESLGVEIKINTPIGSKLTYSDLKQQGYKAFFVAVGLQQGIKMDIEGSELKQVMEGIDFLYKSNSSKKEQEKLAQKIKGKIVGVAGGGDTAIDSARTAIRLGAKTVKLIYRRSENEMPARREEIKMALEENVEFELLTNPVCIIEDTNNSCLETECIKMELGKPDKSGRRRPIAIENSEFKMKIDFLILAIGQTTDLNGIDAAFENKLEKKWGKLVVDEVTYETNLSDVFAGGDVKLNSNPVAIQAITDGREAAISIMRYLEGKDLKSERVNYSSNRTSPIPKKYAESVQRSGFKHLDEKERVRDFSEVEIGLDVEQATKEALRCLKCGTCHSCDFDSNSCNEGRDWSEFELNPLEDRDLLGQINEVNYLNIPISVVEILNLAGITPVVSPEEKCCGHDLYWQGDLVSFKKLVQKNIKLYKDAGVKTIVVNCAEGYYIWKHVYNKFVNDPKDFDFEVIHFTEYLLNSGILDTISFPNLEKVRVTYHDSCRLGRLSKVYDAPRAIINKLPNVELVEMKNIKSDALCCGVSAYICCDEYSRALQEQRIKEAIETGADYFIVTCPKCLTHYNCYTIENGGKDTNLKIIDLANFIAKRLLLI